MPPGIMAIKVVFTFKYANGGCAVCELSEDAATKLTGCACRLPAAQLCRRLPRDSRPRPAPAVGRLRSLSRSHDPLGPEAARAQRGDLPGLGSGRQPVQGPAPAPAAHHQPQVPYHILCSPSSLPGRPHCLCLSCIDFLMCIRLPLLQQCHHRHLDRATRHLALAIF